jgi:hypothetical protein
MVVSMRFEPREGLWKSSTLVIWSLVIQFLLVGKFIDNDVVNNYQPTAADARDYFRLAELWRSSGFESAFESGMRVPGYPALVYVFQSIFVENAPLFLRIFQMLLLALSQIVVLKILEHFCNKRLSLILATAFPLLPLWHFVPILTAELLIAVSFIFLTYLLIKLEPGSVKNSQVLIVSALTAWTVYLKPNSLLLIGSVLLFMYFRKSSSKWKDLLKCLSIFLLLLSPWLVFMKYSQNTFSLTTGAGINLLIGTGRDVEPDGTVLAQSAKNCNVMDGFNPANELSSPEGLSFSQVNSLHTQTAISLWKSSFFNHTCFGLQKVLIAFGGKANSKLELAYGVISGLSILISILMLFSRRLKPIGIYFTTFLFLLAVQAFFFQVDRRFTVPFVLPMFIVCIAIAVGQIKVLRPPDVPLINKFEDWRNL